MVRKKKKRHREEIILPPNDISVFAEEASQFAVSGRKVLMAKKKREREPWILYISVMKGVTPAAREIKKRKKSSSRESLHGNAVNLITIE
ncbi:hypothetical protein TNCV_3222931 [Trichonephila clavipes]|nr:hypothetical protein TNCV_3222931 [Trichonephila clavipes]